MYVLGDQWRDGFLDYHRSTNQLRIAVRVWWSLRRLRGVYVEQPKSIKRIINYVREVGPRAVINKIRSRRAELLRNHRVIAIGLGEIIESDMSMYNHGDCVVFIAPCHPKCVERLVLPPDFVNVISTSLIDSLADKQGIRYIDDEKPVEQFDPSYIEGWSPYSGEPVHVTASRMLDWADRQFRSLHSTIGQIMPIVGETPVIERQDYTRPAMGTKSSSRNVAVLFGLGHYAKTCIIPHMDRRIDLRCIHEIEPTQIGTSPRSPAIYNTSPKPSGDERYDIYFIAGYHHTHADLAVHAIESGAVAVVEKPIATSQSQLVRLLDTLHNTSGRLFACFHMRYNPLWTFARKDLQVSLGQPIHYSCTVYEIPLGSAHWYNWPNSGSRLISNGCHWLDHFLFMNNFSSPVHQAVWRGGNGDLHVSVELENEAVMAMCLTDIGSPRIGVQEHIELRAGSVTVKVDNASRYSSENTYRIIRRKRINKMKIYGQMYENISRRILDGHQGDSIESIECSVRLMLNLEIKLQLQIQSIDARRDDVLQARNDQEINDIAP